MQTPNSETSTNEESEGGNDSPAASDTPGDFLNEKLARESKQNAIADPVDVEQRFDKSGQDQSSDRSSSGKLSEVVQHESGIKSGSILDVLTHQSSGAFFSIFNFAAIAVVLAALAGFFYKAVFLGKPITKLGLLPQLDAVLNPSLKDAVIPIGRDPSGYLIFFPNGHFCEQVWSKFVIPFWNPLVACGFPLLGDPQSFIHSPAHLLGLFASPAAYNFGLLLEIALGGIGMIVVARLMSLSYAASILVALAYSLSPRVLVQIDIGGNEEFFPWIVASFVWLAQKPSYLRAAIAGAASAFLVFAAHPETSFFAILTAGILGFCLIAQNGPAGSAGVSAAAVANPGSADVPALAVANPGSADVPAAAVANPGSADVPALAVAEPGSADVPALAVANPGSADVPALAVAEPGSAGVPPASMAAGSKNSFSPRNVWLSTKLMAVAAIVSMAVVAPLLVPFVQFMRQATVYKDALSSTELPFVSWKNFWDGLLVNQGWEPYFIGSVAVLLIPLAFTFKNRFVVPLALASFFIFAISVPQGPFLDLLSQKPFNYVSTLYGIPDLLLLLSLLAGFGFDALFRNRTKKLVIPLVVGFVLSALLPFVFCLEGSNGVIADAWRSNRSLLTYTSLFATAGFVCSLLWLFFQNVATRIIAVAALLCLNFASIAVPSRSILPNCPPYDMTAPAPLKFLADSNERTVSTGNNFVLPNASMNYGVRDLRCFCPVLPRRYIEFLRACGAQTYNNYFYRMPDSCSSFLDLASVKYVLTRSAVSGANDSTENLVSLGKSRIGGVLPGMRIMDSKLFFDPSNRQVKFDFSLKLKSPLNHRYAIQFCALDKRGDIVWSGSETRISIVDSSKDNVYSEYIPLPEGAQYPLKAGFCIKDTWTAKWILPKETLRNSARDEASKLTLSSAGSQPPVSDSNPSSQVFVVAEIAQPDKATAENSSHYKLVREFKQDGCRVYENTKALPQAYFVQSALYLVPQRANDYSIILNRLSSPDFDMHQMAIVEDASKSQSENESPISKKSALVPANVERPNSNTVICSIDAPASGYLVLTDSNYDGWKCTIDGKDSEIFNCNLLFKAVRIDAGKHIVQFYFAPTSYYLSLACSLLALLAIGIGIFRRGRALL